MSRLELKTKLYYCFLFGLFCFGSTASGFEAFDAIREKTTSSEGYLYDRNNILIHEIRVNRFERRLEWVSLKDISRQLMDAVILSEDHRFWNHSGVDWTALVATSVRNLWNKRPRGASTISMQLASLIGNDGKSLPSRRNWNQKIKQIQDARELEKEWSKDQVLEAYLNLVSFKGELKGISAASYGLFGKAPSGLTWEESLVLASLIRSPSANIAEVERRSCQLARVKKADFNCDRIIELVRSKVKNDYSIQSKASLARHVARKVLKVGKKTVTLEAKLQLMVLDILKRQVLSLEGKNVHDAAALVVHNSTGEVLAYVGGVEELSSAPYVDGVQAMRQAGSTLKPFLYGLAFEKKILTPESFLDDSSVDIPIPGKGVYRPSNYDHEFHGDHIPIRKALASSLNVPAVKTLLLIGVDPFTTLLGNLGFRSLNQSEFYGPSLALGSVDVTLWDLVNAYRTLANQGQISPISLENSGRKSVYQRVMGRGASYLVSQILSSRVDRSLTFGLENPLSLPFWAAVKTGTSKDMRDNWCIGFSSEYTVGVWVGNFSGAPMWNVTGITGAGPAWAEIMRVLHREKKSKAPLQPPEVVERKTREGVSQWYLKGTEPKSTLRPLDRDDVRPVKISYPVEGMIIAKDPDIPADFQWLVFSKQPDIPGYRWILNKKEILPASSGILKWKPQATGAYQIELRNQQDQTVDSVRFVVR